MPDAVIVDVVRSPMGRGKQNGALASLHPVELLAQVLQALVERTGIDPERVDDVLIGCVNQISGQSATPGRQAWLSAGFPVSVPATTIDRRCGSGQQALAFAAHGVMAGAYDIAIAGGLESMSHAPLGSNRLGADASGPGVHARFPELVNQGVAAELIAQTYGSSRLQLDDLSAQSHARAHKAQQDGLLARDIVPITLPDGQVVEVDETIRPATTVETLAGLAPVFGTDDMREKFPDLEWKVTAGNSSQITDGAGAALVMSEQTASRLGLQPRARVVATSIAGDDPVLMLTAVIPATHKVLDQAKLSIDDIAFAEVNEAFAAVPLAWQSQFSCDSAQLNPLGGAIALGHPLGASGVRLLSSMLTSLESTGSRYGLQTMCEAGGMANATIVERL
ncbi:thiolase family protein [Mycolicibacterium confluentis]|uniref:Acetyl-CoA acyltransferase n=1 Tax=Mycolicibacterium confluentis TaxID=28047 RepID=A0A7I7Y214_9MYCO|nr:thiolase family protein [Mycolicibacterium confluentis]MCV7320595.1 thiolase family protein [Mycolicibacterium confluentis]ORV30248.1 acetyl-CoA acetyltransferase [Mycolicibacterium confluentis]BBZ35637.1 acetyl-CoA acyltransferase [Mycolicibacterium confluentis]